MFKTKYIATITLLALAGTLQAQDNGALLDLMVKKKLISDQEAEEVRADLAKDFAATSAGKIALGSSITEMKISGDLRMRFQTENRDYQLAPTVSSPVAGALPQWGVTNGPLFLPSSKGTFYRDTNGDFQKLEDGTKAYKGSNGKVYVVKASDPQPNRTNAVTYYQRENGQHEFFLPSNSGNYYQASDGNLVKIKDGTTIPKGATRYAKVSNQTKPNNGGQQNRYRFRLRLRDEFKLAGGWFGGVELSTASAADSGNQTFGAKDSTGIGGGGFNKYGIFLSKAYLGWEATDWAKITIGKQSNPFYTTDMVWDPDINPDGIVEQISLNKLPWFGGNQEGVREQGPWDFQLVMGQFIFSDNIENGLSISEPGFSSPSGVHQDYSNDAYLFEFQLQASYQFANKTKLTLAPALMLYNSARVSGANNESSFTDISQATYLNNQTTYFGETRNLAILTAPGDVSFKLGGLPVKFLWDAAYNLQGRKRSEEIYGMYHYNSSNQVTSYHKTQDDIAWLAGVQLGENKKAGDWSLMANYRQVGMAAVDPNLTDSDFALGKVNVQGLKLAAAYNFTDYAVGSLAYFYAWQLRDLQGGQATSGANLSNMNNLQILQVDLQIKF